MATQIVFEKGGRSLVNITGDRASVSFRDGGILIREAVIDRINNLSWRELPFDPYRQLRSDSFFDIRYNPTSGFSTARGVLTSLVYVDPQGNIHVFPERNAMQRAIFAHRRGDMRWLDDLPRRWVDDLPESDLDAQVIPARRPRPPRNRFDRIDRDIIDEPREPNRPASLAELDAAMERAVAAPEPAKPTSKAAEVRQDFDDLLDQFLKDL